MGQTEMVFCLKRDITDFTKDIIKEDPSWKYVKAAAPVPVADPTPAEPVAEVDPVEVAPVDKKGKGPKRPHGKGKGHHGKGSNHGKNHGKKNGTEVEEQGAEEEEQGTEDK